jgi:hypothetical protein
MLMLENSEVGGWGLGVERIPVDHGLGEIPLKGHQGDWDTKTQADLDAI